MMMIMQVHGRRYTVGFISNRCRE